MDNTPEEKKKKQAKDSNYRGIFTVMTILAVICLAASAPVSYLFDDTTIIIVCAGLFAVFGLLSVIFYTKMKAAEQQTRAKESADMAKVLQAMFELTRKSQADADNKMQEMSEEYAVPAEEIINAIKALAKVTIGRTKENTDALMNSNSVLAGRIADMQDDIKSLSDKSDKIAVADQQAPTAQQSSGISDDQLRKLSNAVDDVLHELKRMDADISRLEQSQKALVEKPPIIVAGSVVSGSIPQQTDNAAVQQVPEVQQTDDLAGADDELKLDTEPADELSLEPESADEELSLEPESADEEMSLEAEPTDELSLEPVPEDEGQSVDTASDNDDELSLDSEIPDDGLSLDTESENDISLDTETDEGLSLDTETDEGLSLDTGTDDGLSLDAGTDEGLTLDTGTDEGLSLDTEKDDSLSLDTNPDDELSLDADSETVEDDGLSLDLDSAADDDVSPDTAPEPDTAATEAEQNKEIKPDEKPEAETKQEAATEAPKAEEPKPAPEVKVAPVSNDPNAKLSPDQIAALFASAGSDNSAAGAEPEKKEPGPAPAENPDPNRMMTPEEIEALFSKVN